MGATVSAPLDDIPQGQVGWKTIRTKEDGQTEQLSTNVYDAGVHNISTEGYIFQNFTLGGKTKVIFTGGPFVRWWHNGGENPINYNFNVNFRDNNDNLITTPTELKIPFGNQPITNLRMEVISYVTLPPVVQQTPLPQPEVKHTPVVSAIQKTENVVPSINTCRPEIMTQNNKIILTFPESPTAPTDEPADGDIKIDDIVEGFSKRGEQICFNKSCLLLVIIIFVVLWYSGKLHM